MELSRKQGTDCLTDVWGGMKKIRKRASANAPRACGGLLLGLVSNRAINLFGVLVTRGFG
jgi:hypothetical protein